MSKAADEVEAPKATPPGTYVLAVLSTETGESQQKKTPFLRVHFSIVDAGEDVDADALEEAGGMAKVATRKLRHEFYITDDALFRLKDFMTMCGFDLAGKTLGEIVPDLVGAQVKAALIQKANQDGTVFYTNIASFAPMD
tara:strand:- start:27415 stop:27834 length:420 start_codon:yes stop_codon:yes gene_type:complete